MLGNVGIVYGDRSLDDAPEHAVDLPALATASAVSVVSGVALVEVFGGGVQATDVSDPENPVGVPGDDRGDLAGLPEAHLYDDGARRLATTGASLPYELLTDGTHLVALEPTSGDLRQATVCPPTT